MSCANLDTAPWEIKATPDSGMPMITYRFTANRVIGDNFNGMVTLPATGTLLNGKCRVVSGNTVMSFVLNVGNKAIFMRGVVGGAIDNLTFDGSYVNLLDPGDTGTGGGGQSPALLNTDRESAEKQAK